MKSIKNLFKGLCMVAVLIVSTKSYSQVSPSDASFACDKFPTSDNFINVSVTNLIRYAHEFDSTMNSMYENLTPGEQQRVDDYLNNGNPSLINEFPQFDNLGLRDGVGLMRNGYTSIRSRHEELFPSLENKQSTQIINDIIKCASRKISIEREGTPLRASDPCEEARVDCILSVGAQSALMHIGCATVDLTIIGGIICHGAAFTYQWREGRICNRNARKCREEIEK